MGLGFWSKLDAVEQEMVPVFPNEDAAREHIESWDANNDPASYGFAPVIASQGAYATTRELVDAGLKADIGGLRFSTRDPEDFTPTMH